MYPSPIYSEIEMGGVVVVPATVAVNVSNTLYAPRFVPLNFANQVVLRQSSNNINILLQPG